MKEIQGLQGVLDQLYAQMLPQCGALIGVGQGIAGFAALWYIAERVWRQIARAEAVDVYPLLRPFVIGGVILLYPAVIGLLNGVLQPTVTGTAQMYTNANAAIDTLLQQKEAALKQTVDYQLYVGANGEGDEALWEAYTGNAASISPFSGITNAFQFSMAKAYYNFKNAIKEWLSQVLQVVYEAAALCINTIRTFQLIVLAMLGPLVLGFSVFDGWKGSLSGWLARYVHVFLWLPVANIFGAIIANIQVNMLQLDISQIQANGGTYFSSMDTGYLIFLIIGIVGYFTVPTVAGYVVRSDGSGMLGSIVSKMAGKAVGAAGAVASGGASAAAGGATEAVARGAEKIKGN
jgi:conjugative transposon TraJ protein